MVDMTNEHKMVVNLTYDDVDNAVDFLVDKLKRLKCTHILGVPYGGIIPAAMIAYRLKLQNIKFMDERMFLDEFRNDRIEFFHLKSSLIIVDDICDTGETFKRYRAYCPQAIYVAPYYKVKGSGDVDIATICYPNDYWVTFPWEAKPI